MMTAESSSAKPQSTTPTIKERVSRPCRPPTELAIRLLEKRFELLGANPNLIFRTGEK